jgi:Uma2 family endonuclease
MSAVFMPSRTRISVERFQRMIERGVLSKDDRVELIQGEMIDMPPIGSRHAFTLTELGMRLTRAASEGLRVTIQCPLVLSTDSQPEPDLMLLREKVGNYAEALPAPEDVLLLVEVSDTSLDYDRVTKLPLYAQYGIAEVWIVNLRERRIELYQQPGTQGYASRRDCKPGERLAPSGAPAAVLNVADLFPG